LKIVLVVFVLHMKPAEKDDERHSLDLEVVNGMAGKGQQPEGLGPSGCLTGLLLNLERPEFLEKLSSWSVGYPEGS
jgi:hypothetical protein